MLTWIIIENMAAINSHLLDDLDPEISFWFGFKRIATLIRTFI